MENHFATNLPLGSHKRPDMSERSRGLLPNNRKNLGFCHASNSGNERVLIHSFLTCRHSSLCVIVASWLAIIFAPALKLYERLPRRLSLTSFQVSVHSTSSLKVRVQAAGYQRY
jgi:high-affinity Fe2+/Pb2+ permease